MKRLNPPNPTLLFNPPPELTPPAPAFPLNPSASISSDHDPGRRSSSSSSSNNNNTVAASKSNQKKNTQMSTSKVSPIDIINLADDNGDDDDDISFLYATPVSCNNKGDTVNNAISVEQYSADRDLQFAIMASLLTPPQTRRKRTKRRFIDLNLFPDDDNDDDVQVLESSLLPEKPFSGPSITEKGQSSGGSNSETLATFMCDICVDEKPRSESFSIMGCDHAYCSDCMIKYVASKLQENIPQIGCPAAGCVGLLEPEHCRSILPREVFDRWGSALCEAVILASEKFYCPFNDCSALLIDDGESRESITQSQCPNCRRFFCAQCKVPWHLGFECAEFQKLNKDERGREDILLMNLAREKKWMRCPLCKFYVEKSQGCLFMRCRCGHTFCYNCGAFLKDHYCTKCKH